MTLIRKLNYVEDKIDIIDSFKDKELLIYEEIEGSTIFVQWNGDKFIIKPKSLRNEPLNFIDLATQKFYNSAFEYLSKLSNYTTELLNKNWWFCFEYFPDNQPGNTLYHKTPLNNLILKCIVKGTKFKYNYDEIEEYARLFKVDPLPVIFKGKLTDTQLEKIQLFLKTSEDDLKYVFGNDNFSKWFYKLLNPNLDNSFLMEDEFNNNVEKFIIKVNNNDDYSFELLNPTYEKLKHNNTTEYVDTYSLILLNFLEYSQLISLPEFKTKKLIKDDVYIDIICQIFNQYIENIKDDVINKWIIDIPPFFQQDKFKININFIDNKKTKELILLDSKIEYIFKCILGSFSKQKKKPIGVFNDQTLDLFNKFVRDLDIYINNLLKINKEYKYQKSDLKNFKDFYDLKYNTDSEDRVYPDVYDLHDDIESDEKKKKGKEVEDFKKSPIGKPEFEIQKEQL